MLVSKNSIVLPKSNYIDEEPPLDIDSVTLKRRATIDSKGESVHESKEKTFASDLVHTVPVLRTVSATTDDRRPT